MVDGEALFSKGDNYWAEVHQGYWDFDENELSSDYLALYIGKPESGHCTIYIDDFGIV